MALLKRTLLPIALAVALVWAGSGPPASAAGRPSFLRDAEIENTIRTYAHPLFRAAGLDPSAVDIYIVNDKGLNAFVAGGQKLFINSGLLTQAADVGEVIGVIAHEAGHIAGGHLSRTHDALAKSSAQNIIAMVIGGAAALATGRGDVGAVVAAGAGQTGLRNFLAYSRTQEASADQAALRILDATGQSSRGLLNFMERMSGQELLSPKRQDPYLRTHPLTRDRIITLRNHVETSEHADSLPPAALQLMHDRVRAKLFAFLSLPRETFRRYPEDDASVAARYARAIAYYRRPDLAKALPLIDGLIAEDPDDPYFHELKGQMLFENARPREALVAYEAAARLLPQSPLILRDLGRVQLALEDPSLLEPAITNLRVALMREPESAFTWRQLAIAYGRNGQMAESYLALAEEALLLGRKGDALYHATRAEKDLVPGSPGWLKARDIQQASGRKQPGE